MTFSNYFSNVNKIITNFKYRKNDKKCVMVDFYAGWFPPCNRIAPILEEFAKKITKRRFLKSHKDIK